MYIVLTMAENNANCIAKNECIMLRGKSLWPFLYFRPIKERKKILETEMKEIPNRVMLSEVQLINVRKQFFSSNLKDFNLNLDQHNIKDNNKVWWYMNFTHISILFVDAHFYFLMQCIKIGSCIFFLQGPWWSSNIDDKSIQGGPRGTCLKGP